VQLGRCGLARAAGGRRGGGYVCDPTRVIAGICRIRPIVLSTKQGRIELRVRFDDWHRRRGCYLVGGHLTHDDQPKLRLVFSAGEAAIDSFGSLSIAMKYAFGRERPLQDNYPRDGFGQGGVRSRRRHAGGPAWSIRQRNLARIPAVR